MRRMMKFEVWFVPLGLIAVLLAGCGGGSDAGSRVTGIRGVVVEGPPRTATQPRAGIAVLVSVLRPGVIEELTRTTTDAQGRFLVEVPAGKYFVNADFSIADLNPGFLCPTDLAVTVQPGRVTDVVLGYDQCGVP